MSTTFRVVVSCDAQLSTQCLGLFERSADLPTGMWRMAAAAERAGWLRGHRAEQSYDVCPACREAAQREYGGDPQQLARTVGATTVEAAPGA